MALVGAERACEALRLGSRLGAERGGLDENGVNHPWDFMARGKRRAALRLLSALALCAKAQMGTE